MLVPLVFIAFCGSALAGDPVADFLRAPGPERLDELEQACKSKELNPSTAYGRLNEFVKNGSVFSIRALITIHEHCSMEGLTEDLIGVLGRDLFFSHPRELLEALASLNASSSLPEKLARSRGIAEDAQAMKDVQTYYLSKAQVLRPLRLKGSEERLQKRMLHWIEIARKASAPRPRKTPIKSPPKSPGKTR